MQPPLAAHRARRHRLITILAVSMVLGLMAGRPALATPGMPISCFSQPGPGGFCAGSADIGAFASTVSTTIMDTMRGMSDTWTAKLDEFITSLDDLKNILSGAVVKQTEAFGRMEDAAQMETTKRAIGQRATRADRSFNPRSAKAHCETGSGALSLGDAAAALDYCGSPVGLANRGLRGLTENAMLDVMLNIDGAARDGNDLYVNNRFTRFADLYCNKAGFDGPAPVGCNGEKVDADVRFGDTLLNNATLKSSGDQQAVDDLLLNLNVPNVPDPISAAAFAGPSARDAVMNRRSAVAATSVSNTALALMKELRLPVADGNWAMEARYGSDWQDHPSLPQEVKDQLAADAEYAPMVSEYEMMETLLYRRYQRTEWWVERNEMNEPAALREVLNMNAIAQMVAWKQFQMIELWAAMNAAGFAHEGHPETTTGVTALDN